MTEIHWAAARDGRFGKAADWTGGVAPGADDDAILDATGIRFAVDSGRNETVNSLQLAANAQLDITGKTFTARAGTGAGVNAGTIQISDGARLAVGGAVVNEGVIALDSQGDGAGLAITSTTTLTGLGTITLSDSPGNAIFGAGGGRVTLKNKDNTIAGVGLIDLRDGGNRLTLDNGAFGVIDADGVNFSADPLTVAASHGVGKVVNDGLMEATGRSAELSLKNADVRGGGTLFAGYAAFVDVSECTFRGQTLDTARAGEMEIGYSDVTLSGNNRDAGNLEFGGHDTVVVDGAVSFSGGGQVGFIGAAFGSFDHAVLTNVDTTIAATGTFGGHGVTLVNDARGTIQSNGTLSIGAAGQSLSNAGVIQTESSATPITLHGEVDNSGLIISANLGSVAIDGYVVNSGTLSAGTNHTGGGLTVNGSVANSGTIGSYIGYVQVSGAVDNTGAVIGAIYGETVLRSTLENDGSLDTARGRLIVQGAVTGVGSVTVDGGLMKFGAAFSQDVAFTANGGELELAQSVGYAAAISGFSAQGASKLDLDDIGFVSAGQASFSGTATSGVLTVSDGTHTASLTLDGDYLGATFTAASDGHGGAVVTASGGGGAVGPPAHAIVAAMARMGAAGAGHPGPIAERALHVPLLAAPHASTA